MKYKKLSRFESDLIDKLKDPEFASAYIMTCIVDNDLDFLPVALGDIAKAYGISKLAAESGINRRTLYKIFDKDGNPSFELVTQVIKSLGLEVEIKPKKMKRLRVS